MSTRTPARVQPGVPTGGQFAASQLRETDVTLVATAPSRYPVAVPAALLEMTDASSSGRVPRYTEETFAAVTADVVAFIAEHQATIDAQVDDSDDGGWMIGRDICLARNNAPGTADHARAFGWVKDPQVADALRTGAAALGPLHLTEGPGGLERDTRISLEPGESRSAALADPTADPALLDWVARLDHVDARSSHWDKVAVAANPNATRATIEHIRSSEAEPEFFKAIADRPDATVEDLAWASTSYDFQVRAAVIAHENTSPSTLADVAQRIDAELADAVAEYGNGGASVMQAHNLWVVNSLTGLQASVQRRLGQGGAGS